MSYIGINSIGKLFLENTEIAKAYLGTQLVYQYGSGPTPPGPTPTVIPYVRNTSDTAYIDTGIVPDATTRVVVWARNWNPGGNNFTFLFGSRVSGTSGMYAVALLNAQYTGQIRLCYATTNTDFTDKWPLFSWYHKYELNGKDFYVDDALVGSGTTGTLSTNLNIYLFGLNNGGTFAGCKLPIDICAVKIYKNDTLVRDFTPVNSPSVGFYDSVSQSVFTNAGTGTLSYGTFDMSAYTQLDYVESNNGAYFDSGVYGGYAVPIVAKFRTSQAEAGCIVGYRGSSDWTEFDFALSGSNARMYYRLASASSYYQLYSGSQSNFVSNDIVLVKGQTNSASIYKNNTQIGSTRSPTSSTSYVSSQTLNISSLKLSNSVGELYKGRIYYVAIGWTNCFVPAKNSSDEVGLYDTYNDVFHKSESSVSFVAPS